MRNIRLLVIFSIAMVNLRAQVAPTATLVRTTPLPCTGHAVTYTVSTAASIESYTWSVQPVKDLVSYSNLNAPTASFTFSSAASHTVYLYYTDVNGLKGTATSALFLNQSPKSAFNASFNAPGFPTDLILTNYSSYFNTNFWSFSDSPGDSSLNAVKSYTSSGQYTVTLFTFSEKGCKDSTSYDFVISNASSLLLPNIFTPNGDGANDVFQPITNGLKYMNAWVYNRYGVLVTSWTTVNGFWDGYTISGEECSEGVYFIVVDAAGFDGKSYKLHSTITLAR